MAVNPYTTQSISGYNSSPPPDDGSQTTANKVTWAYHKTKIGDPIKTLAEAINTQCVSAINTLALEGWSSITASATVAESDWHAGQIKTATGGRINYPAPSSFENGWHNMIFNASTEELSLQATATSGWRDRYGQFASEVLLPPGRGVKVWTTATVWLHSGWAPASDDTDVQIASMMFA